MINKAGIFEGVSVEEGDDAALDTQAQTIPPGDLAQIVRTVLALYNAASIAELVVNCRDDLMT